MLFGDFNAVETDQKVNDFMNLFDLESFVREPTCFKSSNPGCLDLMLTNRVRNFQKTTAVETG